MKLISKTWNEPTHTLYCIFESKILVGFDNQGYKRYEERKHAQTFYGMKQSDCERQLLGYAQEKERYTVQSKLFNVLAGFIAVDSTV